MDVLQARCLRFLADQPPANWNGGVKLQKDGSEMIANDSNDDDDQALDSARSDRVGHANRLSMLTGPFLAPEGPETAAE